MINIIKLMIFRIKIITIQTRARLCN